MLQVHWRNATQIRKYKYITLGDQEPRYNYDAAHPVESTELEQDENWFYII